ncbi:MAG: hypothetical protein JKY60_10740 [Kordiimonadaceae bacterium]|nr:hypothetical protein [Kordiimonadaceae bacterium]
MGNETKHLFDKPQNVKRILYFLYLSCAILMVLDFVIHRHVVHPWEGMWGFYPVYGFVGCVVLVLVAKWMRVFLMRSEHYYDEKENNRSKRDQGAKLGDHNVDA